MKTVFCITLLSFMAVVVTAMFDGEPKEVKCKGEVIKGTVEFHKNMQACIAEFKSGKSDENRKRGFRCLIVCALTKGGIFDEKGAYVEAKMLGAIDASLSPALAKLQKDEAMACGKSVQPLPVSEAGDKNCANYKPLLKCFRKGWMKTCVDGYDPDVMEMEDKK